MQFAVDLNKKANCVWYRLINYKIGLCFFWDFICSQSRASFSPSSNTILWEASFYDREKNNLE